MRRESSWDLDEITVGIGGDSLEDRGVVTTVSAMIDILTHLGYYVNSKQTNPAEIEGGQVYCQIRASDRGRVLTPGEELTHLVCFNQRAYDENASWLRGGSAIFADTERVFLPPSKDRICYEIPLSKLAKREFGHDSFKNMTMVGFFFEVLGVELEALRKALSRIFEKKDERILSQNLRAVEIGFKFGSANVGKSEEFCLSHRSFEKPVKAVTGNQAIALGALASGARIMYCYPITPASTMFEYFAKVAPLFGGSALQLEDEMATANAVLGSSMAGQMAFTATSGPGLSLMQETLGLSWIAEIPMVVVDVQRGGPSTGSPTKTEQSDLRASIFGAHGDAERVVLAPSDVPSCFWITRDAFRIAFRLQLPVIILSDQKLATKAESVEEMDFSGWDDGSLLRPKASEAQLYRRFMITEDGVSPMAIPGKDRSPYASAGIDHDESGRPNYDRDVRLAMRQKRQRKLKPVESMVEMPTFAYGDEAGTLSMISWGSTLGSCMESAEALKKMGYEVKGLHLYLLNPLPERAISSFLEGIREVFVVEESFNGHLAGVLRSSFHNEFRDVLTSSCVGFTSREIVSKIQESREAKSHGSK